MKSANVVSRYLLILLVLCFVFISGCNTMSGLGEDVQKAGDALEDSADKHKTY